MIKLPRYLYANGKTEEGKDLGAGIIISTTEPLIYGRIILYDNYYAMSEQLNSKPPLAYAALPGYCIAIIFGGILGEGSRIKISSEDDIKTIEAILNAMAAWYLKNKVIAHKGRFRRYEY
jgi:hypothetical protein